MRLTNLGLTLGLVLWAASPGALAGDLSYGGSIKDRGVPVPAPIPVPETFKWYLRADVGVGLMTGGDVTPSGNIFGLDRDPLDGSPFGMSSSWFSRDGDTKLLGGGGVGAYLTPRIRADATADFRTKSDISAWGTYTYSAIATAPATTQVDGRVSDTATLHSTLLLANLYFDLTERGSRFVPYIGVGIGAALHSIGSTQPAKS